MKSFILKKYNNKNNNITNINNQNIKDILSQEAIANSAAMYLYHLNKKINNIDRILQIITYEDKIITDTISISFIRNNTAYNKKLYFILNEKMKKNIIINTRIHSQFFADCTFNVIPFPNKNFKLFVLIAFNS